MDSGHLLITGVTGGLGREVLPRILRDFPTWRVSVLLRENGSGAVADRFAELRRYIAHSWPELDCSRVEPLRGDVALAGIGLTSRDHARLRATVTHILHAAASIKLGQSQHEAWRVNVGGTAGILELACCCPRLRQLAHVSTAYVAGARSGCIREAELDKSHGFLNAYEATKFEAERLVRSQMSAIPTTVFRPSIIVGDSRDGRTVYFDGFYHPLRRIVTGRLRRIVGQVSTPLDLVPVDVVAEAIARLIDHPRSLGRTYHLTAGRENLVTVGWLLEAAIKLWNGPPTSPLEFVFPYRSLRRTAAAATGVTPRTEPPDRPKRAANGMEWFFAYLRGVKKFEDAALRRDLPRLARPHPRRYLPVLLRFCRETCWGRRLPWECEASLAGGLR